MVPFDASPLGWSNSEVPVVEARPVADKKPLGLADELILVYGESAKIA